MPAHGRHEPQPIHGVSAPGASWGTVNLSEAVPGPVMAARELGIPCAMNTFVGTRLLRDGDRRRVDGSAGTVEIVGRAKG